MEKVAQHNQEEKTRLPKALWTAQQWKRVIDMTQGMNK